jgi:Ni,Fe-hydrogenase maturation factor
MQKIYVFGNILVEKDALPVKLIPELKKQLPEFEFLELDPTEEIIPENMSLTIIDTALDIKEARLLNDIEKIEVQKICSLHDFDVGYNLKLMKKFGILEKVNIICIPEKIEAKKVIKQIKKIISNLSLRNE